MGTVSLQGLQDCQLLDLQEGLGKLDQYFSTILYNTL